MTGILPTAGRFFIEDQRGKRILDGHAEPGFSISVGVPPDELLFLRNQDDEAELTIKAGSETQFAALAFRACPRRGGGLRLEAPLREGLFRMPYGPAYYSGYVDRLDAAVAQRAPVVVDAAAPRRTVTWTLWGGSAAFLATSAAFGALAWNAHSDFQETSLQRQASEANDRFKLGMTLALSFAAAGVACAAASNLVGRHR